MLSLDSRNFHPGSQIYRARQREADMHMMGRVTCEGTAKFLSGSDHPAAAPMNEIPKVVFSSTLASADWADAPSGPIQLRYAPAGTDR